MIIVSDTTPIHYLILIGREVILPETLGPIVIPEGVANEMRHRNAPEIIKDWMADVPEWICIRRARPDLEQSITGLGRGETEAIALGIEMAADAVLMDDRKAIREARSRGLTVLTTFAVLELAAVQGLIDPEAVLDELSQTSFRMPPEEVVDEYLRRYNERNSSS